MKHATAHADYQGIIGAQVRGVECIELSFYRLLDTLSLWRKRARTRAQLAQLSAAQLDDIGVSQAQMQVEARKPFWRG